MEAELNEIDQEVLEEENEAHNAFHTEQMRILKEEAAKLAKNTSIYKNQGNQLTEDEMHTLWDKM